MKPPREIWVTVNANGYTVALDGERSARSLAKRLKGGEAFRFVPDTELTRAKELLRKMLDAQKEGVSDDAWTQSVLDAIAFINSTEGSGD